jgi:hypothetical protein
MKGLSFDLIFFCYALNGFSQESTKSAPPESIIISVDTSVFNKKTGNSFFSDSTRAKLNYTIVPLSFDKALPGMQHETNQNIKVTYSGILPDTGRRIYYKSGELIENDKHLVIEIYAVELSADKTIIVSANYPVEFKSRIRPIVERAAKSLK